MTLFVVILLGAGMLMIISALEDTSLVGTFNSIMSGQPVKLAPPSTAGTSGGTGINTPISGIKNKPAQ